MRKFLGPEGEEVEALRITDCTFDYPNPNADRIAGVWHDWRHRCARFVDDYSSQADVHSWQTASPRRHAARRLSRDRPARLLGPPAFVDHRPNC
jgi:hypothetical protein